MLHLDGNIQYAEPISYIHVIVNSSSTHIKNKRIQLKIKHVLQLHWHQDFPWTKATLWTLSNDTLLIKTQNTIRSKLRTGRGLKLNFGDTELMTSNTKQAQSKPHQNRNAKEEKKVEIQRKSERKAVKEDTFIKKDMGRKITRQNKAGASAGEDNP